ncbi:hypothetical protein [Massilia horti]|nr:hypothetical protein [Massilia horti]
MLTSLVQGERAYAGASFKHDTLWARVRHVAVRSLELLGQAKSQEPLE